MALELYLIPVAKAMIKNVENKDPNSVLFYIGTKQFKAKDVKKHLQKEDKFAEMLIKYALKEAG